METEKQNQQNKQTITGELVDYCVFKGLEWALSHPLLAGTLPV